jgi:hypothetical protein
LVKLRQVRVQSHRWGCRSGEPRREFSLACFEFVEALL